MLSKLIYLHLKHRMSGFQRQNTVNGRPSRTCDATANAWAERFSPLHNRFSASPSRRQRSSVIHSPDFSRGGGQKIGLSAAMRQAKWEQLADSPDPCNTLRARLSISTYMTQRMPCRVNMKSVDKTPREFSRRFSGRPGEDWIGHLDMLEIFRANKHQWTVREFYYGLSHTLSGKALTTL